MTRRTAHTNCHSEYEFVTHDGPDTGSVVCRHCGQLILFRRVVNTVTERMWLHFLVTWVTSLADRECAHNPSLRVDRDPWC